MVDINGMFLDNGKTRYPTQNRYLLNICGIHECRILKKNAQYRVILHQGRSQGKTLADGISSKGLDHIRLYFLIFISFSFNR